MGSASRASAGSVGGGMDLPSKGAWEGHRCGKNATVHRGSSRTFIPPRGLATINKLTELPFFSKLKTMQNSKGFIQVLFASINNFKEK